MHKKGERACIENIQGILNRIYYLENNGYKNYYRGPHKICNLCEVFGYHTSHACTKCPLGPEKRGCGYNEKVNPGAKTYLFGYLNKHVTVPKLEARMEWLLKKYKQAGLDIEIV